MFNFFRETTNKTGERALAEQLVKSGESIYSPDSQTDALSPEHDMIVQSVMDNLPNIEPVYYTDQINVSQKLAHEFDQLVHDLKSGTSTGQKIQQLNYDLQNFEQLSIQSHHRGAVAVSTKQIEHLREQLFVLEMNPNYTETEANMIEFYENTAADFRKTAESLENLLNDPSDN
jgi:light-regulated signal transduction histidine kinase (bacteriophytochrome)